jgi:uncharacterized cupin superfamily protein
MEPVVSSSLGVSRVFVGEAGISSDEGRWVAHFLQNSESAVFSVLHLGHSTPIVSSVYWAKEYQLMKKESNWMIMLITDPSPQPASSSHPQPQQYQGQHPTEFWFTTLLKKMKLM